MCSLERHGTVFVLKLVGNNEHWLSPSLLLEILCAIQQVHDCPEATALVTTSEGKFFSNGLDLPWMSEQDELKHQRSAILLHKLDQVTLALMRLNVPTIASVCGHAAAGGLLLAMAHDHRLMRSDRGFLYCSAVDIGFVIPAASMALLRSKMHPKAFKDVVLKGAKYTASMALQAELVDSVHAGPEETLAAALKEAEDLRSRGWNRAAYAALRVEMYDGVVERLLRDAAEDDEAVKNRQPVGFL